MEDKKKALTPTEVQFWLNEIESCLERLKKEVLERNSYPLLIKYFEGEQSQVKGESLEAKGKRSLVMYNTYFPNTTQLINDTIYTYPEVIVTANKPGAEQSVPLLKGALQYGQKRLDLETENKIAMFDMIYAGFCAVEVKHINLEQVAPEVQEEKKSLVEGIVDGVKGIFGGNKQDSGSVKEVEEKLYTEIPREEAAYSSPDKTYAKRINPCEVILDYRAERIKDTRYRGKVIKMSHSEFKAMYPKYADQINATEGIPYSAHKNDSDSKVVILYEVELKKGDTEYCTYLFAKNYKLSEIDYWERPYRHNGFSLKVQTIDEYGLLYPKSRAALNKSNQDDINNYLTFAMEVAERNIPKRIVAKDALDNGAMEALRSNRVNDVVVVKGTASGGKIETLTNTNVSTENKELLQGFFKQSEKLWSVSESRISGQSNTEFATEIQIQEQGFQVNVRGIQNSVRNLWRQELDGLKDIQANFWDEAYYFQYTGLDGKPTWYEPQVDAMGNVITPLADEITADAEVDIDLSSMLRPNKEKLKKDLTEFATWLISPAVVAIAQMNGKVIDLESINKVVKEWGWNPDNIFKDAAPPPNLGMPPTALPPSQVNPEAINAPI